MPRDQDIAKIIAARKKAADEAARPTPDTRRPGVSKPKPKRPTRVTPFVPRRLTQRPSAAPKPAQPVVKLTGAQPPPVQPVVKLTGAQPAEPARPGITSPIPRPEGPLPFDVERLQQPPQGEFAQAMLPLASLAAQMELDPFIAPAQIIGENLFSIHDQASEDWWGALKEWAGTGAEIMTTWFKGGLIGLNFIQKIPERLILTPVIAGSTEPPLRWWTNRILMDINPEVYEAVSTHPITQAVGKWKVGPESGWYFDDTFGVKAETVERLGLTGALNPEGYYSPDWKAERAIDFENFITDDAGNIKWDILMGQYNHEGDFLDQLFDTTGLSGIAVSLALEPEKFNRFQQLIDDDVPMAEVIMNLEDPWAEFTYNTLTDPLLWVGLGTLGPKLATISNKFTYLVWPPSYPIERAAGWALNTIFRSGYAAKGAIIRELYEGQGSAKRWLLGVSKVSQHSTYSDAVEDTMRTLALRYDNTIDPEEPIEYFQRILLSDKGLVEGKLGPQRAAQLADAIALMDETVELDISTILEHYGPFADLLEGKTIAEVALEGALQDPEAIGYYLSRAISDQYAKQLGIHAPARGSIARNVNWLMRLMKEQWLAVNPGYLANNFLDNTVKTITSNYTPTFDLHAHAKLATYIGETFDEVLPANVAQSIVADAFDVERHLATADLPWPLGEPEGWAKTVRFLTGQKIPDKMYDWMVGDSRSVRWLNRVSYAGLLRRGFDASAAIEQSARATIFVNAFDDFMKNQGLDTIINHISRNPDVPPEFTELVMNRVIRKPADFDAALTKIIGSLEEPVPETWISGMAPAGTPDFEFVQELRRTLDDIQTAYVGDFQNPQFMRKVGNAFARARKAAKQLLTDRIDEVARMTEPQILEFARESQLPELQHLVDDAADLLPVSPLTDYDDLIASGRMTIQDMARVAGDDAAFSVAFDPDLMKRQLDMAAAGRYPNNPVIGVLFEDLPNADSLRAAALQYADTPGEDLYRQAIEQYNLKYRLSKGLPPIGEAFPIPPPSDVPVTPRLAPEVLDYNKSQVDLILAQTEDAPIAIYYDPERRAFAAAPFHPLAAEKLAKDVGPPLAQQNRFSWDVVEGNLVLDEGIELLTPQTAQDFLDAGMPPSTTLYDPDLDEYVGTLGELAGVTPKVPVTPRLAPEDLYPEGPAAGNTFEVAIAKQNPDWDRLVYDPVTQQMAAGEVHDHALERLAARSDVTDPFIDVMERSVDLNYAPNQNELGWWPANVEDEFTPEMARNLIDAGIPEDTAVVRVSAIPEVDLEKPIGTLGELAGVTPPTPEVTPVVGLGTAERRAFTVDQLASAKGILEQDGKVFITMSESGVVGVDASDEKSILKVMDALGLDESARADFFDEMLEADPLKEWVVYSRAQNSLEDMVLDPNIIRDIKHIDAIKDIPNVAVLFDSKGTGVDFTQIRNLVDAGVDPNSIVVYSDAEGARQYLMGTLGANYDGFFQVTADASPSLAVLYDDATSEWVTFNQEKVIDHILNERGVTFYYNPLDGHIVIGEHYAPHVIKQIERFNAFKYIPVTKEAGDWFIDQPALTDLGMEASERMQNFLRTVGRDGDNIFDVGGNLIGSIDQMLDISAEVRLRGLKTMIDDPFYKFERTDLGAAIVYDPETGLIASADVHNNAARLLDKPEKALEQFRLHDGQLHFYGSQFEAQDHSIFGPSTTRDAFQAILDAGVPGDTPVIAGSWSETGVMGTLGDLAKNYSPMRVVQPFYGGPQPPDVLWSGNEGIAGWWDNTAGKFNFVHFDDAGENFKINQWMADLVDRDVAGDQLLNVWRPVGEQDKINIAVARRRGATKADEALADFLRYLEDLGTIDDFPIEINGKLTTLRGALDEFSGQSSALRAIVEKYRIKQLSDSSRANVGRLKMMLNDLFPEGRERLLMVHWGDGDIVWGTSDHLLGHNTLGMDYMGFQQGDFNAATLRQGKGIMTSAKSYDEALMYAQSLSDLGARDNMPFRVYGVPANEWPGGLMGTMGDMNEYIGTLGEFLGREVPPTQMHTQVAEEVMNKQANLDLRASLLNQASAEYQALDSSITEWDRLSAGRIVRGIDTKYVSGPEAEAATKAVGDLKGAYVDTLEKASYHGIGETNRVLFDYQARNSWEEVLRTYAPFTTWQLRNPLFWAQAFAKQPALVATAIAYYRLSELQRRKRNLTGRFEGTIGAPTPGGGYLAADASKVISIFGQYREPFAAPGTEADQAPGLMGAMQWIVQQGRSFGINPWPWFSYPMEKAGIVPEGTTQFSFGPQQRAIELAMRQAGVLEAGEGLFGTNPSSEFLMKYWTNRRLAEMEAEGLIDHGQFLEAINNPENADYEVARVWVADLQQKFGTVGLFNPFTLKYASPGEVAIRGALAEKRELPPEIKQWYNTNHPYLESYSSLFQGEVENEVDKVYFKYEALMDGLNPWESEYKQLTAERAAEIEALAGPQTPSLELKRDYLADPIKIGGLDEIGGTYDVTSARTSTLHRLRDVEPRAGEFVLDGGEIDWEAYNTALDDFLNTIPILSDQMGIEIDLEGYIKFRYRWASPERVAYDLYKEWRSEGWEVYEDLQPEADDFLELVNWAAEQQFLKDLSTGFTPIEAGKLKAENLAVWSVDGLPYDYRQELLGMYGKPVSLTRFSGAVADILGMDPRGEERFVLARQLSATLPDIFGEDDPVQAMTSDMYDYYYNLMPDEKREVREFLGIEQFDLADLTDAEVANLYRELGLQSDRTRLAKEGILMFDEPQGLPILPVWDELTPEEEADIEQLRVDWYRYNKARESGVYGTWTDLMEKYYSQEDSGAGRFWGMLNGISLSSAAFDDPVVGPLLSKATREILQPTDEQYERAATYLEEHLPELIDSEKTQLILDHPDWYEKAQQQRGEFDRFRVLELEILKGQYYAIYYKDRPVWQNQHPDEWKALRGYLDREKARALAYPYYSYFFKSYDYRQYYGGRGPDEVPAEIAPQLSEDYLLAIDDMEAYIEGQSDDWTDGMSQFFGPPAITKPEDGLWVAPEDVHEVGRDQVNKYWVGETAWSFKNDPLLTDHAKKFLAGTTKVAHAERIYDPEKDLTQIGGMREERDPRKHTSYTLALTDVRNISTGRHEAAHALDSFYNLSGTQSKFGKLFYPYRDADTAQIIEELDDPYGRPEKAYQEATEMYMPVSWNEEFFVRLFVELAANPEEVPSELKEIYGPYIKFP